MNLIIIKWPQLVSHATSRFLAPAACPGSTSAGSEGQEGLLLL